MTLLRDYMNSMNVKRFTFIKYLEAYDNWGITYEQLYILENCKIDILECGTTKTGLSNILCWCNDQFGCRSLYLN